jgi:hypothetical protein
VGAYRQGVSARAGVPAAAAHGSKSDVAKRLADETDADVTIEGKFGTMRNGDIILRTRKPFAAPNDGSTLLDFDNVSDQIQDVYSRFVQDGKIRP